MERKDVGKPLTTDEIRAQAHNWTLAGDVGLLAHLEKFSESILKKTQDTQNSMDELINSCEETSTLVNNVTNQFLAIQNSQFVENRVYDDETPSEEKKIETKEIDKEAEEQLMLSRYKEAVEKGVKLLNTHFEEVQLPPNSDSDEEDFSTGDGGLIWKPRNPYSSKPFPLLIGSAEWWADDNVGLGEYEENVDSERVLSESDSDMEADRNVEKRVRMSSSSSFESETGPNKKLKIPESTSTYDDIFGGGGDDTFSSNIFHNKKDDDLFGEPENLFGESETVPSYMGDKMNVTNAFHEKVPKDSLFENEEGEEGGNEKEAEEIQPAKPKKVENAFTKELTAKLGNVATKQAEVLKGEKAEIPRKPETKQNAFPIDDDEDAGDDLFSSKPISAPPAVKKPSLFSDIDDDQLFGGSDEFFREGSSKSLKNDFSNSVKSSSNNSSQANSDVSNLKTSVPKKESLFDGDLFANIDDDDDTLFSSASKISHSQSSKISLDDSQNLPKVKFSTPFEPRNSNLNVSDDLFGAISAVDVFDGVSANVSDSSLLNAARLLDDDITQDLGFSEHTPGEISRSKSLKIEADDSPGLFQPQLSSTRRISQETSDYKTQKMFDTDSSVPQSQDGSKDRMGHNEKSHYSRTQSDMNKSKGLFEEEDEDDLFSSKSSSKPPASSSLFDDNSSTNKKSKDSPSTFSGKKTDPLFDEEDNLLFGGKQPDSVSVSSSRSSLFDEVSGGKSTLASVFDSGNKNSKTSDDLFSGENLFSDEKSDDLFSSVPKSKPRENESLFGDVDDAEDLFSGLNKSKNLFPDDSDDLFGGKTPKVTAKPEMKTTDPVKSDPVRPEPVKIIKKSSEDDLFGEKSEPKVKPEIVKSKPVKSEPVKIPKKSSDDDLFGGEIVKSAGKPETAKKEPVKPFEDDLFGGKFEKSAVKPETDKSEPVNVSENLSDDDLFGGGIKKSDNKKPEVAVKPETAKSDPVNPENVRISEKPSEDDLFGGKVEKSEKLKPEKAVKPEMANSEPVKIPEKSLEDDLFGKKSEKSKPEVALKPETVKSDPVKPETVKSDTVKPETVKSDPVKPEMAKSETVKPEKSKSETVKSLKGDLFGGKSENPETVKSDPVKPEILKKPSEDDLFGGKIQKSEKPKSGSDDLFSTDKPAIKKPNANLFADETDDLFGPKKSTDVKKSRNLFNDLEDDDNLFSSGAVKSKKPETVKPEIVKPVAVKPETVKSETEDPLGLLDNRKPPPDKTTKPTPPKSLPLTRNLSEETASVKPKKIGKLNIPTNLNINPTALLPNASAPKKSKEPEPPEANLDSPVEVSSNLLKCTNKDRVKIQVQRRPQSRRARQEALRSSGIDFGSEEPTNTSPVKTINKLNESGKTPETNESSSSIFHSVENSPETLFSSPLPSNPLSPSTDEEDYFNVPELDVNFEKEDQSIFKSNLKNNNVKKTDNDNLLFDGAPVLSPLSPKKDVLGSNLFEDSGKKSDLFSKVAPAESGKIKKHKIFDDEDVDDDNLFTDSKPVASASAATTAEDHLFAQSKPLKLSANNDVVKKNLFDDDENDDLFSDKPVSQSSTSNKISAVAKSTAPAAAPKKTSTVDKSSKEAFVDPLGLMSNPE